MQAIKDGGPLHSTPLLDFSYFYGQCRKAIGRYVWTLDVTRGCTGPGLVRRIKSGVGPWMV